MDGVAAPGAATRGDGMDEWRPTTGTDSGNPSFLWVAALVVALACYYFYSHAPQTTPAGGGGKSKDEALRRARELQQEHLQNKMLSTAAPEPEQAPSAVKPKLGVAAATDALRRQREAAEAKRRAAEIKKKKRQAYLRRKKEEEAEEEKRRKDRELGPGWQYRENGGRGDSGFNSMDPGAGSSSGGYKAPKRCVKRGGG